ncbi:MAG: O-antigen ligase family protein [Ferruginibacter sp.]
MGGLSIPQILGILTFLAFFVLMFTAKKAVDKNRLFIQYILLAYPLIAIYVIPGALGLNTFHLTNYLFYFFFHKGKRHELKHGKLYLFLFGTIVLAGVMGCFGAATLTADTTRAIIEFFATFIYAKILVDECIDDPHFFYEVIKWLKITVLVSLVFLAIQFVVGVNFSLSKTQNPNVLQEVATRYPSFFQDPQKYAQFLAAGSFLFLMKEWNTFKLPVKNYIFLVLTLVAILYTGGRGGFGGWVLGFSLIVIFGNAMYKIYAVLIGGVMFTLIYNFSDSFAVFNRTDKVSDSYEFRFGIWKDAYGIFLDNPLFGIAPGNYANYVSVHNPDQFWMFDNEVTYYDHPESGYLKLLTEYGGVGFVAIILFILLPMIFSLINYLKIRDTTFLLMVSSILSWMVGFYTVYSLGDIRIQVLIVTIICLLITNYKRFEEVDEEEDEDEPLIEPEQAYAH